VIRSVPELANAIIEKRRTRARDGAILVAISGIDASGKGTLASRLAVHLGDRGMRVGSIGVDAWLTPLDGLSLDSDPGEQFYLQAIRFDEVFERIARLHREDESINVILLEGIFLFKRDLRFRYDLSIWVDCGFETALARALARNQERLSREHLLADYRRIYFPAQELHLRRDNPRDFADIVYLNDRSSRGRCTPNRKFLKPGHGGLHLMGDRSTWKAGLMVTCQTFVEFLMDYLSGGLPESQRDEFDEHLAACVACVAYMKTYVETIELGKAAFRDPDAPVPADVPEYLVKAILAARGAKG
jgi:uridine kinase